MVERTNTVRRANRAVAASPYKRPTISSKRANEPKKSGFLSAVSNLFSSFWRTGDEVSVYSNQEDDNVDTEPTPVSEALLERGLDLQAAQAIMPQYPANNIFQQPPPPQPQQAPAPPPPAAPVVAPPRSQLSPPSNDRSSNIDAVATFLTQNAGRLINDMEIEGIVSLLQSAKEPETEKPIPFRFSTTPLRDTTPGPPADSTQGTRKMLTKNPNGTYVWRGGGSSKPRNRYSSPGFPASRPAPTRMKLSPAKPKPKADGKRRRINDDTEDSSSVAGPSSSARPNGVVAGPNGHASASDTSRGPTSSSISASFSVDHSPSPMVQSPQKLNGAATVHGSTPRIRTAGIKPTAPTVPSPLRQTWGQTDSPSPPAPPKATRAANFISELVRETAPREPSIFSNPYQAASPVPVPIRSTRKPPATRRRAVAANSAKVGTETAKPPVEAPPERKPEAELSPQKIIEATLPKGAKRSRPPADLSKQREQPRPEPGVRRSARLKSPEPSHLNGVSQTIRPNGTTPAIVEEMPEEGPSAKKSKPNGSSSSLQPAAKITERPSPRIEELQDQVMFSPVTQSEPDSNVVLPAQTIEPEEKSERSPSSTPATLSYNNNPFSAAALGSKSGLGVKSSAPKAPSKLRYSIQVEKEDSPKEAGKSLPSLGLGLPSSRPGPSVATLSPVAAPSLSASSPSNTAASTISTSITSISTVKGSAPKTPEEIKAFVAAVPVADLPQYTFDFPLFSPGAGPSVEKAKAAAKDVPVTSLPAYDFDSPPRSTASAGKTSVSSDTSAVKEVFDWAAAGLKMPSKPADNWDCSVCGLSNPPTAVSKCQVCEEPKPGASKAPAAPAFDWAAAGMKQPVATAGWKCSTCMLDNADSLTKCSVCESPR